jgi:hypothetical protein
MIQHALVFLFWNESWLVWESFMRIRACPESGQHGFLKTCPLVPSIRTIDSGNRSAVTRLRLSCESSEYASESPLGKPPPLYDSFTLYRLGESILAPTDQDVVECSRGLWLEVETILLMH